MELREGIKHIFDENAVVIMGAGASYGAKNAFGSMPSGKELSQYLYSKCDIKPDDPWDLQDAAQTYEEQFGPARLISEIRSIINCASFTSSHADIYSLPWIRYYTTNYDDVALLAASSRGKTIEPVTVTSEFYGNQEKRNVCVHINGYIGKLTSDTLHHEFKLTANRYQAQENILNSQWGVLFENDLETAKCIVIIGLSLKYDLDLRRIIYNSALREKTIIIDSPGLTENSENQLKRFGTVYKIGVDKFAEEIRNIGKIYLVNHREPKDKCYYAFTYESNMKYDLVSPSPDVIFRFYINGQFDNSLLYRNSGQYSGCVQRECNAEIKRAFTSGKRFVFVHSDMGNGKTVCINEIRYSMLEEGYYIFTLTNADSSKLREDIAAICLLAKEKKVLVIIDDYINYMEVLRIFTLNSEGKEQFLLTARSALNYNKMPTVFSMFSVEENQSAIFDINVLNNTELTNCVSIFDRNGLFGRNSGLNKNEKIRHLSARKYGARRFQSIMLDVLESEVIKRKISELIQIIREQSQSYHDMIALILLKEVMNLRLRTRDIGRIGGIDISTDALFKTNPAIMELLSFNNGGEITIKSPITARYILQKTISPDTIITSCDKLFRDR